MWGILVHYLKSVMENHPEKLNQGIKAGSTILEFRFFYSFLL